MGVCTWVLMGVCTWVLTGVRRHCQPRPLVHVTAPQAGVGTHGGTHRVLIGGTHRGTPTLPAPAARTRDRPNGLFIGGFSRGLKEYTRFIMIRVGVGTRRRPSPSALSGPSALGAARLRGGAGTSPTRRSRCGPSATASPTRPSRSPRSPSAHRRHRRRAPTASPALAPSRSARRSGRRTRARMRGRRSTRGADGLAGSHLGPFPLRPIPT